MNNKPNFNYEIYPIPQKITYKNDSIVFNKNINIVKGNIDDDFVLNKLISYFKQNKITFDISNNLNNDKLNIVLDLKNIDKKDGYILNIDENIYIYGNDLSGLFYGVVTLISILKQSDRFIQKLYIEDYPNIIYRGYIEGFYGYPWSHNDRINLMEFGGDFKFNTYICP